MKATAVDGKTR